MTAIIFLDRFVARIISHSGQKVAYCSVTIFTSLSPHHHSNDFHLAHLAEGWAGTIAPKVEESSLQHPSQFNSRVFNSQQFIWKKTEKDAFWKSLCLSPLFV